jgi:hypothetical protein
MNPLLPHGVLFDRKVRSYLERWPWLQVEPNMIAAHSAID